MANNDYLDPRDYQTKPKKKEPTLYQWFGSTDYFDPRDYKANSLRGESINPYTEMDDEAIRQGQKSITDAYKDYARRGANITYEHMENWYLPERKQITYTEMPTGMHGYFWGKNPEFQRHQDIVGLQPKPHKYAGEYFDPLMTYIHEAGGHAFQTPGAHNIDERYFENAGRNRDEFIDRMLDVLGYDQKSKSNFYSSYPSKEERLDEMRARLMAMDAYMPYGRNIWEYLDPHEINWFLETTRKGWTPKK